MTTPEAVNALRKKLDQAQQGRGGTSSGKKGK